MMLPFLVSKNKNNTVDEFSYSGRISVADIFDFINKQPTETSHALPNQNK